MTNRWESKDTEDLFRAIISLKDLKEGKKFLRDLLTDQEIVELGKRWKAARMLHQKISYTTIVRETGLSSTTVARISKWLQNGAGGYKLMLKRFHPEDHPGTNLTQR